MASWGQEWIDVEPSVHEVDVRLLMWDIRRNVKPLPDLPSRFTVRFFYPDPKFVKRAKEWLGLSKLSGIRKQPEALRVFRVTKQAETLPVR